MSDKETKRYMRSHIGEVNITNGGDIIRIIDGGYTVNRVLVEFTEYNYDYNCTEVFYPCFIKGNVRNKLKKNRFGVGYIGFPKYNNYKEPLKKKACKCWEDMLYRCYSNSENCKSYDGCSVIDNWHNFQHFYEWYKNNYVKGYHIDKDLLVEHNKIYGDKTCIFIPPKINSFLSRWHVCHVHQRKNKTWRASTSDFYTGIQLYSRTVSSKIEAVNEYKILRKIQVNKASEYMKNLGFSGDVIDKLR